MALPVTIVSTAMTSLLKTSPLALLLLLGGPPCFAAPPTEVAPGVMQMGTIGNPNVTESSGLSGSRRFPGIFWTHNDQGNNPFLYAMTRTGRPVAKFRVTGAKIEDWEDLDVDLSGNLYIADIGNNDLKRDWIAVHRVKEPSPGGKGVAMVRQTWKLEYPDQPFDAEAFYVSEQFGYIISREVKGGVSLYRFPLVNAGGRKMMLDKVAALPVEFSVRGADMSADSRRLGLITEGGAYVLTNKGRVLSILGFTPFEQGQMEGAAFAGDGLLVSAESGELFLYTDPAFRTR